MIYAVFESSYGYNTSLRLGKLYQFTPTKLGNDEFLITNDEKKSLPSIIYT